MSPPKAPLILVPARVYARLGDADVGMIERTSNAVIALYTDVIIACGGVPLIIPTPPASLSQPARSALLQPFCDLLRNGIATGLMITGGPDVSPKLYLEEPQHCGVIYEELDDLDLTLFRVASELSLPILGICRGAQVINVGLGGSCWQTMSPKLLAVHDGHGIPRDSISHNIDVDPKSRFFELLCKDGNASIGANSLHHQCLKTIGDGLKVAGSTPGVDHNVNTNDGGMETVSARNILHESSDHPTANGGTSNGTLEIGPVPELIEHESKWIFGIQCHPEELAGTSERWRSVFEEFVKECSRARKTF